MISPNWRVIYRCAGISAHGQNIDHRLPDKCSVDDFTLLSLKQTELVHLLRDQTLECFRWRTLGSKQTGLGCTIHIKPDCR
jgi:hypothetical protein